MRGSILHRHSSKGAFSTARRGHFKSPLPDQALAFYQLQLQRHAKGAQYLEQRGLQDPAIIEELGIDYAPGGNLHRHLATLGYSFASLLDMGLINHPAVTPFAGV
jgi:DNA primase